jgi:hypothetical protein
MSSNSTISTNKATWTSNTIFSQFLPSAVTTGLTMLSSVLADAQKVLMVIKNIIQTIEIFVTAPGELLVTFLKNYSQAIITSFKDILSLGGNYIIIHPFNVVKEDGVTPKYPIDLYDSVEVGTNILFSPATVRALPVPGLIIATEKKIGKTSFYKHILPSLTPQQAFNEFFSSFNNPKDTHKPTWSVNTNAVGMGFVITTGNISAFFTLLSSIDQFLNFKEIKDAINSYSHLANTGLYDATGQGQNPSLLSSTDFSAFGNEFSPIQEGSFILQSPAYSMSAKLNVLDSIIENQDITGYHWGGMNLYNFPLLQDVCTLLQKLVKRIIDATQTTDQAIKKIANAIIKKITGLQDIIIEINQVAVTIALSLEYTGLYTFTIPQGTGGIQYIQQAIQTSLSTSPLSLILNTTQFTMLGFFGAGDGINLSSWEALFQAAYNATAAELQSLLSSLGTTFQYKVTPDFTKQIFSFGQTINLSVSSSQVTSTHPYYYTYVLKDNNNNILSQQTETNILAGDIALVNSSSFTVLLQNSSGIIETVNYSITITVFDGIFYNNTYSSTFHVSNAVSNLSHKLTSNGKGSVTINDNAAVSLMLGDKVIEQQYTGPGTILPFGANAQSGQNLTLNIQGTNGSISLPVDNYTGYPTYDFDTFADLKNTTYLRVETLPIMICINFDGILKWGRAGVALTTYNLPVCIKITEAINYEYFFQDTNNVLHGPYFFVVSVVPASSLSIC